MKCCLSEVKQLVFLSRINSLLLQDILSITSNFPVKGNNSRRSFCYIIHPVMFLCCSTIKDDTVKPVLRGHLCDKEKMAF